MPLLLTFLLGISAVSATAVLHGEDDDDPEPPPMRSMVRSGDWVVKVNRLGEITAANKKGEVIWTYRIFNPALKETDRHSVGIGSDHVVAHRKGSPFLIVLELRSGKSCHGIKLSGPLHVISLKGDRVTVRFGAKVVGIDLRSGKLLKVRE